MAVELEKYDIVEVKDNLVKEYEGSQEVDDLTKLIVLDDPQSIITFGNDVVGDISKVSDGVLNNMNTTQLNDTGNMMTALTKVMDSFDISEIKEEPKGLKKLFTNAEKQLNKFLLKYDNMGKDIQKIYVQLEQYQSEIKSSNNKLEEMFNANMSQYKKLEQYILAGEQGVKEIQNYLDTETMDDMTRNNTMQGLELLKQRIQDLRMAETVAMQALPMLKSIEFSNLNLSRKIDSAFIVTLPIFKQSIAQAVLLKRQKIQMNAMSALEAKTNEMLIQNAQNTADQTTEAMRMATTSSVKIETVEETYRIIRQGIEDTIKIKEEADSLREADKARLIELKKDFKTEVKYID